MSASGVLSESEKLIVRCLEFNRTNLRTFCDDFQLSANLFELLERGGGPPSVGVFGGVFPKYRIIAARDGALNLFHFGKSLDAIRVLAPHCPVSVFSINTERLSTAVDAFDAQFPNVDNIRHAIAHAGELSDSPSKLRSNIMRKIKVWHGGSAGPGGVFRHGVYERTFSIGKSGKVFTLAIDGSTTRKLNDIILLVDGAFASPQ
jgi:hypothetical protein